MNDICEQTNDVAVKIVRVSSFILGLVRIWSENQMDFVGDDEVAIEIVIF